MLMLAGTSLMLAACGGGEDTAPGALGVAGGGAQPTAPTVPSAGTTGGAAGSAPTTGAAGITGGGAAGRTPGGGAAGAPANPMTGGAAGATTSGEPVDMGAAGSDAPVAGSDAMEPGAMAGSGGEMEPTTPSTGTGVPECLQTTMPYDGEGPFSFEQMRGTVNVWKPNVPAGCKVPVIHLANGTGASCSSYGRALERFATWGFLTTCYESANTGSGEEGLEALKTAVSMFPDLADLKFGSTGHSQGGQASFIVLQYAEKEWGDQGVYAGLAMQPASGFGSQPRGARWQEIYAMIKSPMFMFSGAGTDGLVSQGWVQDAFNNMSDSVEKYHWAKAGGAHIPTPQGEEMQIGPAWFRWKLLGDQKACEYFKAIPMTDSTWDEADVANAAPCM